MKSQSVNGDPAMDFRKKRMLVRPEGIIHVYPVTFCLWSLFYPNDREEMVFKTLRVRRAHWHLTQAWTKAREMIRLLFASETIADFFKNLFSGRNTFQSQVLIADPQCANLRTACILPQIFWFEVISMAPPEGVFGVLGERGGGPMTTMFFFT